MSKVKLALDCEYAQMIKSRDISLYSSHDTFCFMCSTEFVNIRRPHCKMKCSKYVYCQPLNVQSYDTDVILHYVIKLFKC